MTTWWSPRVRVQRPGSLATLLSSRVRRPPCAPLRAEGLVERSVGIAQELRHPWPVVGSSPSGTRRDLPRRRDPPFQCGSAERDGRPELAPGSAWFVFAGPQPRFWAGWAGRFRRSQSRPPEHVPRPGGSAPMRLGEGVAANGPFGGRASGTARRRCSLLNGSGVRSTPKWSASAGRNGGGPQWPRVPFWSRNWGGCSP